MVTIRHIGTTIIAAMPIAASQGIAHRQRERLAVSTILTTLLGDETELTHDAEGAPHIPGYHISISHSRLLAVVAIDPSRPIGIDAEEWRPALERVKHKFLSPAEIHTFTSPSQLLRAWTVKEAAYKIVGARAVNFADTIEIAPDMEYATACGRTFAIATSDIGPTYITLLFQSQT